MKALFDTNVFRDIQRGKITADAVARAKERLANGDQGLLSPLSLIELGSHITEEEKDKFERFHVALRAAHDLCSAALPDPEAVLRDRVFGALPDGRGLAPGETLEMTRLIAQASSYDELVKGQVTMWQGVLARVSYNAGYLRQFREDYEDQYVEDMHQWVVGLVCPDWKGQRAAGKMAYLDNPEVRTKLLAFLDSDDFKKQFFALQAARAGVHLSPDAEWDEDAFLRMKPFFDAYLWILKKVVDSGYNPAKNKNDYNDIHFLLYLSDPDLVLVTRDGGTARKVAGHDRVMTFEEWLAK
jgi:hypothetical protein